MAKKMTKQEKIEWDALYQYVKINVLGYDSNQSLSRFMVLRLKGLLVNKYVENNNIENTANYSYNTILMTFKYCMSDINKAFRTKSFKDEKAKFNYALAIVESNINTVYTRMQNTIKSKEMTEKADTSTFDYSGAEYKPKTGKASSKLKDLW